ncbi:MAG: YlxM family DNA-binding protein [Syntrophomonadaceae bacterium]|jgi:predicted DNA-binding protein YlxM (UPF0122 family)|nr:YlxM family DNA-binding protein [Syntrophomonadaceae bacterium]
MLEKVERMSWLMDFYGPLLTERQQRILQLHYDHDWSLAEIAAELGVSRQAVHDVLRRSEKALEAYEERLGLLEKFRRDRSLIRQAVELLSQVEEAGAALPVARVKRLLAVVLETPQE